MATRKIADLTQATTASDADLMVIQDTSKTKKITFATLLTGIKSKLGVGTAANLNTTSKELVGAINEINTNIDNSAAIQIFKGNSAVRSGTNLLLNAGLVIGSYKYAQIHYTFWGYKYCKNVIILDNPNAHNYVLEANFFDTIYRHASCLFKINGRYLEFIKPYRYNLGDSGPVVCEGEFYIEEVWAKNTPF